ncbi:hypothetical protein [uncultured Corynebacterium sp.]|uniref:hypothetical protein n=1 Tax=uncultured Corynebacterium sp. TaxID=159447 RepID=UPI0025D4FA28|nr:hypothetical protein [uncultured Corynebacterium sp.]
MSAAVAGIVCTVALVMAWNNLYNADAFLSDDAATDVSGQVGPALTYVKVGTIAAAVSVLSLVALVWRTSVGRKEQAAK